MVDTLKNEELYSPISFINPSLEFSAYIKIIFYKVKAFKEQELVQGSDKLIFDRDVIVVVVAVFVVFDIVV